MAKLHMKVQFTSSVMTMNCDDLFQISFIPHFVT